MITQKDLQMRKRIRKADDFRNAETDSLPGDLPDSGREGKRKRNSPVCLQINVKMQQGSHVRTGISVPAMMATTTEKSLSQAA